MPQIVMIAGPNGAGKSTIAPYLLSRIPNYLNADDIAKVLTTQGLGNPDLAAGRELLNRWDSLSAEGSDFTVETTLATRSFAPRIAKLQEQGYRFHLIFLYLPSVEEALRRVEQRVRMGGHNIPETVVRRRYEAGLRNFFEIYRPLADSWRFYDASDIGDLQLIARGRMIVRRKKQWKQIQSRLFESDFPSNRLI